MPDLAFVARKGALFDPDRFPFLEGRQSGEAPAISLWCRTATVWKVYCSALMVLDGERLSYRTLDVEQIGSVYEAIMGFRIRDSPPAGRLAWPRRSEPAPPSSSISTVYWAWKAASVQRRSRTRRTANWPAKAVAALRLASSGRTDVVAALWIVPLTSTRRRTLSPLGRPSFSRRTSEGGPAATTRRAH